MEIKRLFGLVNNKRGQILPIIAIAMTALLGITALVTDVGFLFAQKRQLQNTADAAALAGARELINGTSQDAKDMAEIFVEANGVPLDAIASIDIENDNSLINVHLKSTHDLFFARVLGISIADVSAEASAAVGPMGGMSGLIPIGITEAVYEALEASEGEAIITKDMFGIMGAGNWAWVNLDYVYGNNPTTEQQLIYIRDGFPKIISIGNTIATDTGANIGTPANMKKGLEDTLNGYKDSGQTLYVPIIENTDGSGNQKVKVVGFAAIILTDWDGKSSGFTIEAILNPDDAGFAFGNVDPNAPDFGLKGVSLVMN